MMNIQSKLRQLRKAKKLRPMLVYGLADEPGIDVPDGDYPHVETFLKHLFRELKKEGFGIRINHWGSIFLIEPERQIPLALCINKTVEHCLPSDYEKLLEQSQHFQIISTDVKDYLSKLTLSYRAWRPGTKWRFILLNGNDDELIGNLLSDIKMRVSSLVSSPKYSLPIRDKVSFHDVVALLTYNYIEAQDCCDQPAWMQEISTSRITDCEIFNGGIHFTILDRAVTYPLMKSDIVLLEKILPNITSKKIHIENYNA